MTFTFCKHWPNLVIGDPSHDIDALFCVCVCVFGCSILSHFQIMLRDSVLFCGTLISSLQYLHNHFSTFMIHVQLPINNTNNYNAKNEYLIDLQSVFLLSQIKIDKRPITFGNYGL